MKFLFALLFCFLSHALVAEITFPHQVESFTIKTGKEYRSATITKPNEFELKLVHEAGISRIKYHQLTPSQIETFGFDVEKAKAAALKLKKKRSS